jgi:N-ethylmaleimide reductase
MRFLFPSRVSLRIKGYKKVEVRLAGAKGNPVSSKNARKRKQTLSMSEEANLFAIVYGRPYIANPDLVARFKQNAPLNTPDPKTFYGGGDHGYTDYPSLN